MEEWDISIKNSKNLITFKLKQKLLYSLSRLKLVSVSTMEISQDEFLYTFLQLWFWGIHKREYSFEHSVAAAAYEEFCIDLQIFFLNQKNHKNSAKNANF